MYLTYRQGTEVHESVVPLLDTVQAVELVLVVVLIDSGLACVWPSDKANAVY